MRPSRPAWCELDFEQRFACIVLDRTEVASARESVSLPRRSAMSRVACNLAQYVQSGLLLHSYTVRNISQSCIDSDATAGSLHVYARERAGIAGTHMTGGRQYGCVVYCYPSFRFKRGTSLIKSGGGNKPPASMTWERSQCRVPPEARLIQGMGGCKYGI